MMEWVNTAKDAQKLFDKMSIRKLTLTQMHCLNYFSLPVIMLQFEL